MDSVLPSSTGITSIGVAVYSGVECVLQLSRYTSCIAPRVKMDNDENAVLSVCTKNIPIIYLCVIYSMTVITSVFQKIKGLTNKYEATHVKHFHVQTSV